MIVKDFSPVHEVRCSQCGTHFIILKSKRLEKCPFCGRKFSHVTTNKIKKETK